MADYRGLHTTNEAAPNTVNYPVKLLSRKFLTSAEVEGLKASAGPVVLCP